MKSLRLTCLLTILLSTLALAQSTPDPAAQEKIVENYGKLPLTFEANQGQTDPKVKFLSRGGGYTLFLTGDEAVFSLRKPEAKAAPSPKSPLATRAAVPATNTVLRMKLLHANPSANIIGADELPGKSNYFTGNDPKKWRSNVATYATVKYQGVYPGVDLVYYGNQRQLEYDFVVAPGADPRRIQFDVRGARHISRDERGGLLLQTAAGEIRWRKPFVYQEKDGVKQELNGRYVVRQGRRVGFEVADYDSKRPLIIDPALMYSTYLGGSLIDNGSAIAVDSSGNAYVTGQTFSTDFPATPGAFQTKCAGGCSQSNAFVAKLNPTGSALVYSTYLGGSGGVNGGDYGYSIAVDVSGNSYVSGFTYSSDFPITPGAFQTTCNGGTNCGVYGDAFVTKLNAIGSALAYSTYIGGSGAEEGFGISLDASGDAYLTGLTQSSDFPTTPGAFQTKCGCTSGVDDAFVTELNPSGSALVYSTYLGGSNQDVGWGIAVDTSDNAYVIGSTCSTDFPTTPGAFQTSYQGGGCMLGDAFVTKLNPSGSALVYSTYLGGSNTEWGIGLAVDASGDAYVTGTTFSTDFPTTPGAFQTVCNQGSGCGTYGDAFVTELNPSGSALVYSTYLGGSFYEQSNGLAIDAAGDVYVTGSTCSADFPTTPGAFQTRGGGDCTSGDGYDAFVTQLNPPGSALAYSTFLGGSSYDTGRGVATDASRNLYVVGTTSSTDFPNTPGAFQTKCGGGCSGNGSDAFVTKFVPGPQLWPVSLNFGDQTVGIASPVQKITLTNSDPSILNIASIGTTGPNKADFTQANNCGSSLAVGANCTISVTFTPKATGTRTAAISVSDDAPNSPQTVQLAGIGVESSVVFSPTSLTFPTQLVFTDSKAQQVTLTNTGLGILKITAGGISGQFGETTDCTPTLAPGASCTANVTFKPTTKGTLTGAISITDNAPGSPQKVPLSGTGTYVQLKPTSENFGTQPIHTTSLPRYITFTNKGSGPVNFTGTGISITGSDQGDFAETNNCGTSVASGASCKIRVTFTPSALGKRTADVSLSDDGGGSPQTVPLTGTGTP
jgi:hypothetical protein